MPRPVPPVIRRGRNNKGARLISQTDSVRPVGNDATGGWLAEVYRVFKQQPTAAAQRLQSLLNFMCASQLYLQDNFRLGRPLTPADIKTDPSGHWGVCPPTNHVLAALGPVIGRTTPGGGRVRILHGAGHAGPSLRAWTYLSGEIGDLHAGYRRGRSGYEKIIREFPGELGGEVTPLLPGIDYMGGMLGSCLAFAQGLALGAPDLVVPVIGDGECETGDTAASWIAGLADAAGPALGSVLPIVLLNGYRMGSRSLLGNLPASAVHAYFSGLGYVPVLATGAFIAGTRKAVLEAMRLLAEPAAPGPPVLLLTMPKGDTCPEFAAGRRVAGTAAVHKAPLPAPGEDPARLAELEAWLRSYHPQSLLDEQLEPTAEVAAVSRAPRPAARPASQEPGPGPGTVGSAPPGGYRVERRFRQAVVELLESRAASSQLGVFSPDEFSSNLSVPPPGGALAGALRELLNEQVCHAWLEGWLTAGQPGLFVGYEGFAMLTATHIAQYAKKLHLLRAAARPAPRSLNYLLSSTCWENSYTHQDPGLLSALLARDDPLVRVFTPATVGQCLAVLAACLDDFGHVNVIVFSKRPMLRVSPLPAAELMRPWSVWPGSAAAAVAELTLVAIGNVMAVEVQAVAGQLRETRPQLAIRMISVSDLSATAADASAAPMCAQGVWAQIGDRCAVLVATATHAAPIRGMVAQALPGRRAHVAGYRDPGRPVPARLLMRECGCDAQSLMLTALRLVAA